VTAKGIEIRKETAAMFARMSVMEPGSKRWVRVRDDIIALNWGIVVNIGRRLARRFGMDDDDAIQETAAVLVEILPTWDPARATLDRHLWFSASEAIRAEAESVSRSGISGGTAAKRRLIRSDRVRQSLSDRLGRTPTDDEVIAEVNAQAHARQRDPKRSGSLLDVDELRRARAAFSPAESFGDVHAPACIVHPDESWAFVTTAIDRVRDEMSEAHAAALLVRFSLDSPDTAGDVRPWSEVAGVVGVSISAARRLVAEAQERVADDLISDGRSGSERGFDLETPRQADTHLIAAM
jgi:hypothetical protein